MKPDEFFKQESARLQGEYDAGSLRALGEAIWLFSENGQALPRWAADAVLAHLGMIYEKGLGARRGRGGGHKAVEQERHLARWNMLGGILQIQRIKHGRTNMRKAADEASVRLRGAVGEGEPRQVEASYRKIEKQRAE